jgi:hypothetical protein
MHKKRHDMHQKMFTGVHMTAQQDAFSYVVPTIIFAHMHASTFRLTLLAIAACIACQQSQSSAHGAAVTVDEAMRRDTNKVDDAIPVETLVLDSALYRQKMLALAHDSARAGWPVNDVLPNPGALLPFHRIVAYYGNFYSKNMGILGALPADQMKKRLLAEVDAWEKADTTTNVIPAIHYIAVTAQKDPGAGKTYRLRMPASQIDKAIELAKEIDGVVFLDIQVGHAKLSAELEALRQYLAMPQVHLGIDPEYSMKNGRVPGESIGTFDAEDINLAAAFLADLVNEHQLPPKVLVIHRFTKGMVTNSKKIKTRPEVQVVMHMDGFGFPAKKKDSYRLTITQEPVQFAGFKLFYKNDTNAGRMMTPEEILGLLPKPVYIQYQ